MTTKTTERHRCVQTLTKWVVHRRTVGRAVCAIVAVTSDTSHAPIELWTAPRRRQVLWNYSRRNLDARPSTDSPTGDSTCAIAISSRTVPIASKRATPTLGAQCALSLRDQRGLGWGWG